MRGPNPRVQRPLRSSFAMFTPADISTSKKILMRCRTNIDALELHQPRVPAFTTSITSSLAIPEDIR